MATSIQAKIAPLPRGDYSSSATYAKLDVVSYNGSSYMAIKAVPTGTAPTNTTYWQLLAATATIPDGSISTSKLADGAVTLAKLDSSVSDKYAEVSGTYEDMVVGSAEQLLSTQYDTDSVPYAFRKSPYGDREFDEIHGGTIAWNQRVQNGNFANTGAWSAESGVTLTVSNNVGTITSTIEANGIRQSFYPISNHKYLATFEAYASSDIRLKLVIGTSSLYAVDVYATSNKQTFSKIGIFNGTLSSTYLYLFTATVGTVNVSNVMVIDLTAMFGSAIADYIYSLEQSNTGSGVAWFKSLFPKPYYAYNAGELISVSGLSAHKMTGFNQWDGESETGYIDLNTGNEATSSTNQRSKYVRVLPSTKYCYINETVQTGIRIAFYDANKVFVGNFQNGTNTPQVFTTPSNAFYMRFYWANISRVCINISGERNGEYEPYESHSYALDDSLTLRGIPKLNSANEMYFDGDVYSSSGEVSRRYGVKTLNGSETWTWQASNALAYTSITNGLVTNATTQLTIHTFNDNPNLNDSSWAGRASNAPCVGLFYGSSHLFVKSSSITSAEDAKAYFTANPTNLIYELNTPTTESASPYVNPQICNEYGTEEYISAEQSGVTMIVGHNTKYPQNLRKKIEGLPWNFSNLIAPTEVTNKASRNYTVGSFLIMNNTLYKVTSAIANGGTITVGTNVTATTIMAEILAL